MSVNVQVGAGLAEDIRDVVVPAGEIQEQIRRLAGEISRDYQDKNPVLVGALKGVLYFLSDLIRAVTIPVEIDLIAVSNYSPTARERGLVRLVKDLDRSITARHVIFVEDVVDTGLTLNYILRNLRLRQPASLEVCTLFNKPRHRLIDVRCKYKGIDLPDLLVVGYGLDYREKYRYLPFVGSLRPEVFSKG